MLVKVKGHWSSSTFGNRADGEVFNVPDNAQSKAYIQRGYFEPYQTKVVRPTPAPTPAPKRGKKTKVK